MKKKKRKKKLQEGRRTRIKLFVLMGTRNSRLCLPFLVVTAAWKQGRSLGCEVMGRGDSSAEGRRLTSVFGRIFEYLKVDFHEHCVSYSVHVSQRTLCVSITRIRRLMRCMEIQCFMFIVHYLGSFLMQQEVVHIVTKRVIQGDQKVSVHLMITIQKVTSNVQSVPRQSQDIY